jgi:hypothetical protein
MSRALQIITQQQRAMSSALLAVRTIARKALRSGSSPDFSQLVPLLDYVERFPETLHQANEIRQTRKNICSVSWKRASLAWRVWSLVCAATMRS